MFLWPQRPDEHLYSWTYMANSEVEVSSLRIPPVWKHDEHITALWVNLRPSLFPSRELSSTLHLPLCAYSCTWCVAPLAFPNNTHTQSSHLFFCKFAANVKHNSMQLINCYNYKKHLPKEKRFVNAGTHCWNNAELAQEIAIEKQESNPWPCDKYPCALTTQWRGSQVSFILW